MKRTRASHESLETAPEFDALRSRLEELTERARKAEDALASTAETEETLRRLFNSAQRTAAMLINEARQDAERLRSQTEAECHRLLEEASEDLQPSVDSLRAQRAELWASVQALSVYLADERARVLDVLNSAIEGFSASLLAAAHPALVDASATPGQGNPERPPHLPDSEPRADGVAVGAGGDQAALVYDSVAQGTNSSDDFWLGFQHKLVRLQVRVVAADAGWDLHGYIDPAQSLRVVLELEGSEVALVAQAHQGEFKFHSVPHGLVRLSLVGVAWSKLVLTDWFLIRGLEVATDQRAELSLAPRLAITTARPKGGSPGAPEWSEPGRGPTASARLRPPPSPGSIGQTAGGPPRRTPAPG